uniref:Uncharacterized protein n=1 Tax=Globodera rostochiensis TaxID=31243 RepID=A0A914HYT0_GLORO
MRSGHQTTKQKWFCFAEFPHGPDWGPTLRVSLGVKSRTSYDNERRWLDNGGRERKSSPHATTWSASENIRWLLSRMLTARYSAWRWPHCGLLSLTHVEFAWVSGSEEWAVVTAMVTTMLSVLLILFGTFLDKSACAPYANHPAFSSGSFFLSIGIFSFSFGGHSVFPTIQITHREEDEWDFPVAQLKELPTDSVEVVGAAGLFFTLFRLFLLWLVIVIVIFVVVVR